MRVLAEIFLVIMGASALTNRARVGSSFGRYNVKAATATTLFLLDDTRQTMAADMSDRASAQGAATDIAPDLLLRPDGRLQTRRVNMIRDAMWLKRISTDLTSAEFVVSMGAVAGRIGKDDATEEEVSARRTKFMKLEALDLDRLRRRLGRNMDQLRMRRESLQPVFRLTEIETVNLQERMQQAIEALSPTLKQVKAAEESQPASSQPDDPQVYASDKGFQVPSEAEKEALVELKSIALDFFRKPRNETLLRLFMREDGTVDWDSARGEVVNFGGELYKRLNGRSEEEEAHVAAPTPTSRTAVLKIAKADPIVEEKEKEKDRRQTEYDNVRKARDEVAERLRVLRWEEAVEPSRDFAAKAAELRTELRSLEKAARRWKKMLGLANLDQQMEVACVSLINEIDQGFMPEAEQRLLVAEFGLLDTQLASMLKIDEEIFDRAVEQAEVTVMEVEVRDLLVRLGLADADISIKLEWGPLSNFWTDLWQKVREGLKFYWLGTKIMFNDIQYALGLIARAATTNYTLKPREVRTLRRTFKDVLTFIPFVIILIIPLTPVGHVLVFSFIQRFFPDFFPSCYTDRRQNLLKIYESIDKVDSIENELESGFGAGTLNIVFARWVGAARSFRRGSVVVQDRTTEV